MDLIDTIDYINLDEKKYISINMNKDIKIMEYQIEMVNNNQGNGILYIDKRQLNEDIKFLYDITNYISLKEYIADSSVDGNSLFSIFNNLINIILSLPSYLLNIDNILLDEEHILVDKVKKTVGIIYVPCENKLQNTEAEFKQIIKQVIIDCMSSKDNMDYFINEILPIINNKDYSLNELNKTLSNTKAKTVTKKIKIEAEVKPEPVQVKEEPKKNSGFFSSLFKHKGVSKAAEKKEKEYYISFNINDVEEKVKINKDEFVLGRLKSSVDFCIQSNVVGKVHAKLVKKKDTMYIIDLSSKNGTYINGMKLNSDTEQVLKDGDEIKLGNVKGQFKIL